MTPRGRPTAHRGPGRVATFCTVFVKEWRDALRDRRTLLVVLLTSIALGPLSLALLSSLVERLERQADSRELLAIGLDQAPTLGNYLARQTFVAHAPPADWEARLKDGRLGDPVLIVPRDFEPALAHGEAPALEVIYSSANARAQVGVGRVERLLQGLVQEQAGLRLIARGVPPALLSVARIDEHDVADPAARAAQLTAMLPFFVLMAMAYGALNAALDTTAGERERGSLEPLLATPATRGALVVGKWAAVCALALLVALLSCLGFLPAQAWLHSASLAALFRFGAPEVFAFVGLLVPLAAALSAVMMAVGIRCRSFKEAQAANSVVLLGVSLVPLVGMLGQEGDPAWYGWVPGLAQTTAMTHVLKGLPLGPGDVVPGIVVGAAITVVALVSSGRQMVARALA